MKQIFIIILLFNFLYAGDKKYEYESMIKNIVYNYDDALELAKKEDKYILALVSTTGCPFCERTKKYVLTNEKVVEIINNHYIFVNFERPNTHTYPDFLSSAFCPTMHMIDSKTEDILYQIMGYKTPRKVIKEISMESIKEIEELWES